jgi:N-acetylglucosamine-6-phosphate deacetylase
MLIRGRLLGDSRASDLDVRNGRLESIKPASKRRAAVGSENAHILPLLTDIQVNGYAGIDLQDPKLRPEDIAELDRTLALTGVGAWIPTIITNAQSHMERACRVIAEALQDKALAKHIPGIHLEGPYISPQDGPRGAHAKRHVRAPNIREFDACIKAAGGKIVYTTLAPETRGAVRFIRHAVRQGVVVSLGHHAANAAQIAAAAGAGATMVTHLGNGTALMLHRHDNPIWPQMADDRLACSLIPDLHHVPEPMLRAIVKAKGKDHVILTSDVVHLAGLKPGPHKLAGDPVTLHRSGVIRLTGTQLLAGSATPLIQGVFNAATASGLTLVDAVHAATANPARVLGLKRQTLRPRTIAPANFTVCRTGTGGGVVIEAVFRDGRELRPNQ